MAIKKENSLQEQSNTVINHEYKVKKINQNKSAEITKRRFVDTPSIEKRIDYIINYMIPVSNSIDSIKEYIKPNVKYIVQIPKEILDKIDSGDYDL